MRGQDGKIFDYQIEAASLHLAEQGPDEHFEVIKAERIDPISGEVLHEFYNEKDRGSI